MVSFVLKLCVCKRADLKGRCLKCPASGFLFGGNSIRINSPSLELLDMYCVLMDAFFQLQKEVCSKWLSFVEHFLILHFSQVNKLYSCILSCHTNLYDRKEFNLTHYIVVPPF